MLLNLQTRGRLLAGMEFIARECLGGSQRLRSFRILVDENDLVEKQEHDAFLKKDVSYFVTNKFKLDCLLSFLI